MKKERRDKIDCRINIDSRVMDQHLRVSQWLLQMESNFAKLKDNYKLILQVCSRNRILIFISYFYYFIFFMRSFNIILFLRFFLSFFYFNFFRD